MQLKAILFDLDGVILDSEKIYQIYWKQAATELGYQLDKKTALKLRSCDYALARQIITEATGKEDAYDKIRARRKELMKDYWQIHGIELKDGAAEFLFSIKDLPVRKVIVTSSSKEEKYPYLEKLGVAEYFDGFVSVKEVERGKPYPEVYLYACGKLGLDPSECIAIEDSPNGIKSAYGAGVKVVMVPDLSEPDEEIEGMCTVVRNLDGVKGILERLLPLG